MAAAAAAAAVALFGSRHVFAWPPKTPRHTHSTLPLSKQNSQEHSFIYNIDLVQKKCNSYKRCCFFQRDLRLRWDVFPRASSHVPSGRGASFAARGRSALHKTHFLALTSLISVHAAHAQGRPARARGGSARAPAAPGGVGSTGDAAALFFLSASCWRARFAGAGFRAGAGAGGGVGKANDGATAGEGAVANTASSSSSFAFAFAFAESDAAALLSLSLPLREPPATAAVFSESDGVSTRLLRAMARDTLR